MEAYDDSSPGIAGGVIGAKLDRLAELVNRQPAERQAALLETLEGESMTSHEPKNADAVRRNGNLTVVGHEIKEKAITQAFGKVVRLIDDQANACDLSNTNGHNTAVSALNEALVSYQSLTEECRRAIARK